MSLCFKALIICLSVIHLQSACKERKKRAKLENGNLDGSNIQDSRLVWLDFGDKQIPGFFLSNVESSQFATHYKLCTSSSECEVLKSDTPLIVVDRYWGEEVKVYGKNCQINPCKEWFIGKAKPPELDEAERAVLFQINNEISQVNFDYTRLPRKALIDRLIMAISIADQIESNSFAFWGVYLKFAASEYKKVIAEIKRRKLDINIPIRPVLVKDYFLFSSQSNFNLNERGEKKKVEVKLHNLWEFSPDPSVNQTTMANALLHMNQALKENGRLDIFSANRVAYDSSSFLQKSIESMFLMGDLPESWEQLLKHLDSGVKTGDFGPLTPEILNKMVAVGPDEILANYFENDRRITFNGTMMKTSFGTDIILEQVKYRLNREFKRKKEYSPQFVELMGDLSKNLANSKDLAQALIRSYPRRESLADKQLYTDLMRYQELLNLYHFRVIENAAAAFVENMIRADPSLRPFVLAGPTFTFDSLSDSEIAKVTSLNPQQQTNFFSSKTKKNQSSSGVFPRVAQYIADKSGLPLSAIKDGIVRKDDQGDFRSKQYERSYNEDFLAQIYQTKPRKEQTGARMVALFGQTHIAGASVSEETRTRILDSQTQGFLEMDEHLKRNRRIDLFDEGLVFSGRPMSVQIPSIYPRSSFPPYEQFLDIARRKAFHELSDNVKSLVAKHGAAVLFHFYHFENPNVKLYGTQLDRRFDAEVLLKELDQIFLQIEESKERVSDQFLRWIEAYKKNIDAGDSDRILKFWVRPLPSRSGALFPVKNREDEQFLDKLRKLQDVTDYYNMKVRENIASTFIHKVMVSDYQVKPFLHFGEHHRFESIYDHEMMYLERLSPNTRDDGRIDDSYDEVPLEIKNRIKKLVSQNTSIPEESVLSGVLQPEYFDKETEVTGYTKGKWETRGSILVGEPEGIHSNQQDERKGKNLDGNRVQANLKSLRSEKLPEGYTRLEMRGIASPNKNGIIGTAKPSAFFLVTYEDENLAPTVTPKASKP